MLPRLLLAVLLLGAACGDVAAPEAAPPGSVEQAGPAPTQPAAADAPATTSGAALASTAAPAPAFDGPPAPDFSLPLENRDGTFVLSEAATPVYLTFWAEW